jgi:ArsR family transcriptional regulator
VRLLIVDFAPHALDFLRQSQAHRRLGFSHAQMEQWISGAGMSLEAAEDLVGPAEAGGLTVTIWTALDNRVAATSREMGEAR